MNLITKSPYRDVQEDLPIQTAGCGHEIYRDELIFQWEGRTVCLECFSSAVERLLRDHPAQLACEMGLEVERLQ